MRMFMLYRCCHPPLDTDGAIPGSFWGFLDRRSEAVHVVAPVTSITEQELVIILTCATQGAGLALYALPGVQLHVVHHARGEL